jgi:hypothetical protein
VTNAGSLTAVPYAIVSPKFTVPDAGTSVVHVIDSVDVLMAVAVTAEMTGLLLTRTDADAVLEFPRRPRRPQ